MSTEETIEVERWALVALRADLGRVLRAMFLQGIPVSSRAYQGALGMKGILKGQAASIPNRRCGACGLQAADAEEWGYALEPMVCTIHESAWS